MNDKDTDRDVLNRKVDDAFETPGFMSEFDPQEAEAVGAFEEDALTEEDAYEAAFDEMEIQEGSDGDTDEKERP